MTEATWQRLQEAYEEQSCWWARGYQGLTGWAEYLPPSRCDPEGTYQPGKLNAFRAAFLTALAALPDPTGWYRFCDLAGAMQKALEGHVSLLHIPPHDFYGRTEEERRVKREERLREIRENWIASDLAWLENAVRGPLYHLGLLELGGSPESPETLLLRLSGPARAALWESFRGVPPSRAGSPAPEPPCCWVVQPNLDVVVFMDRITPDRLAFLSRVAVNDSAQSNTASYRLTRESVYRALESGLDLASILDGLAASSERPLTDSVRRTLADWAAKRERLRLRQSAVVLEFHDAAARDAAAASWQLGSALGERFLRLDSADLPPGLAASVSTRIDYRAPPRHSLQVADDGIVAATGPPDLVVREQLSRWAEPSPDGSRRWRLTQASVADAAASGGQVARLEQVLSERAESGIPALLRIALKAWASGRARQGASLSVATLLHLDDYPLVEALLHSPLLKPYLGRQLGPGTFLIAPELAHALREILSAFGIPPSETMGTARLKTGPAEPEGPEDTRSARRGYRSRRR